MVGTELLPGEERGLCAPNLLLLRWVRWLAGMGGLFDVLSLPPGLLPGMEGYSLAGFNLPNIDPFIWLDKQDGPAGRTYADYCDIIQLFQSPETVEQGKQALIGRHLLQGSDLITLVAAIYSKLLQPSRGRQDGRLPKGLPVGGPCIPAPPAGFLSL